MSTILDSFCEGAAPPVRLTVTQWADRYRILPDKASIEPGRYDSSRTPYMVEIMDCLSVTSTVQDVTFKKATQLGASEAANNFFGYVVDVSPGPMLYYMPTDKLASEHSKGKLTPTIEDTPCLKEKITDSKHKGYSNTILTKDFPGGILFLSGANSPTNLRNKSIKYLVLDDYDGFPLTAGQEGDPGDLAERRTDTYSVRKKIYRNSTPTIKGLSRIDDAFLEGDQRTYQVKCPFCGYRQQLVWGGKGKRKGIKFQRNKAGNVVAVWYECAKCHEGIDESYKPELLAGGKWIPEYKTRKKRSYHLSSLYSPLGWVSWRQIVEEFLKAKDSPERLKVWTNTRMAEVWDEKGSQPAWKLLRDNADAYKSMVIPEPVAFLTAGVDVQENRLVVVVRGWSDFEESFLIYWTELFGNPGQPEVWAQLDMLLEYPFEHSDGYGPMRIHKCAIDSGYLANDVYNYCRARQIQTMATKGASQIGLPIVNPPSWVGVNFEGERLKGENGVQLWRIGTDTAKTTMYNRLSMAKPGPGFYHFPDNVADEYYKQLTAEKRVTQFRNGYPVPVWIKLRPRNDVLDCEVLAMAAAKNEGSETLNYQKVREIRRGQVSKPAHRNQKPKSGGNGRASKW